MEAALYLVDTFSRRPFAGNPATVVVLPGPVDEAWCRRVAGELGRPSTAFVWAGPRREERDGVAAFALRVHGPRGPATGWSHATLAAAHALWEDRLVPRRSRLRFRGPDGEVHVGYERPCLVLRLPAGRAEPIAPPAGWQGWLDARPAAFLDAGGRPVAVFEDEAGLTRAAVRVEALAEAGPGRLVLTAPADPTGGDGAAPGYVLRVFAPAVGIEEDAASLAPHAFLAPWWAARLDAGELRVRQRSPRGGRARVRVRADAVEVLGEAVTIARGRLGA